MRASTFATSRQPSYARGAVPERAVPGFESTSAMRRLLAIVLPHMFAAPSQRTFQLTCSATMTAAAAAASSRYAGRARRSKVAAGRDTAAAPLTSSQAPTGQPANFCDAVEDVQRLRQLDTALSFHNDLYFNLQRPEISDAVYDDLKLQYRCLAGRLRGQASEEVALPVGAPLPPASGLRKVRHPAPMLSLAAVQYREEVAAWLHKTLAKLPPPPPAAGGSGGAAAAAAAATAPATASGASGNGGRRRSSSNNARIGVAKKSKSQPDADAVSSAAAAAPPFVSPSSSPSSLSNYRWVVEPKVDGLAVRALYRRTQDGMSYQLEKAATRGDGAVGEDVTHNALYGNISGLPPTLRAPSSWSTSPYRHHAAASSSAPTATSTPPPNPSAASSSLFSASGPEWVDVRGEVFLRTADLELVNTEQRAAGQPPFANSRNAAAGAVRLLDPAECRRRRLSFVAYAALAPKSPPPLQPPTAAATAAAAPAAAPLPKAAAGGGGSGAVTASSDGVAEAAARPLHDSQWGTLEWLQDAGFAVSPDNRLCLSPAEALAGAEEWMARRGALGYDADGVVIKLDDTTMYDMLGTAGSDPRWAVAWKFPAGEAVTRLTGMELSVGRQGQITPLALLMPVQLGGVVIRRASLHNVGLAAALGLHVGDAVVLRRSGDVIPQVVRVLPELRPPGAAAWSPPTACPACGGPLRQLPAAGAGSGEQLLCDNPACGARSERRLLHFAAVCLPGSNVSRGVVGQLVARGLLSDPPDFYRLDQTALSALPRFGPGRTSALLTAVEASRRMAPAALLRGLNIRLVGEAAAAALGHAFASLEELAAAPPERITVAAGVGPAVARSVADWFRRPANRQLMAELREAGVRCVATQPAAAAAATPEQTAPPPAPPPPTNTPADAAGARFGVSEGDVEATGSLEWRGKPQKPQQPQQQQAEAEAGTSREEAAGQRPPGHRSGLVGLAGVRVCVTGSLQGPNGSGLLRSEFKRLLEAAGAELHSTLRKDTQLLIVGEGVGRQKLDKARGRSVRITAEEEFWRDFWSEA